MLNRTILMCLAGFVLVKLVKMDSKEILFKISSPKINGNNTLTCDHEDLNRLNNIYTVLEGEEFNVNIKYKPYVNHLNCRDYKNDTVTFLNTKKEKNVFTFKVQKRMGTLWDCTILAHRNSAGILPNVSYNNNSFTAAYCFMKMHVRQTKSPQKILVNGIELKLFRTKSSVPHIDFTAQYQYVENDVVNATCANFLNRGALTMEYPTADTLSDKFNSKHLLSNRGIGFVAKLHSEHDNTYMICTNTELTDYTKVMVTFVMSTKINIIKIRINGMNVRPKLDENNYAAIEYKYLSNRPINVVCEVERTDMRLLVLNEDDFLNDAVSSYKKNDTIPEVKSVMSFHLKDYDKELRCASDYRNRTGSAETVDIHFTKGDNSYDYYPLHMELASNDTVLMELYTLDKLKVIYYELNVGETLKLNCYPLFRIDAPQQPLLYIHFKDSEQYNKNDSGVSLTLNLTHRLDEYEIVCYMKEQLKALDIRKDKVFREIRVILRDRVLTTTTSTTTEGIISTDHTPQITTRAPLEPSLKAEGHHYIMLGAIAGVTCIVIVCVSIVIFKLRKHNHSQIHDRNYENLQTPSEASIPPYPPQWQADYAVPTDCRAEDTTYSEPCQTASATTAVSKNKSKQKHADLAYAILDIQKAKGRKNVFKETDDPNYSEVYANRPEQSYAKVLPKSMRNKVVQDNNPYSCVTNEPSYANVAEPEPLYCELQAPKQQGGQYVNINNM